MATTEPGSTDSRLRPVLIGIASVLAVLMFMKFVIVKPIAFLALAILFGVGAFLLQRGSNAGRILLLVLLLLTAVIFGAHLFDKGFDADRYQNNTDYVVILLGFPLAVVGLVISAITLRTRKTVV